MTDEEKDDIAGFIAPMMRFDLEWILRQLNKINDRFAKLERGKQDSIDVRDRLGALESRMADVIERSKSLMGRVNKFEAELAECGRRLADVERAVDITPGGVVPEGAFERQAMKRAAQARSWHGMDTDTQVLNQAEARVRSYMFPHFSTATIEGVVHALRGKTEVKKPGSYTLATEMGPHWQANR